MGAPPVGIFDSGVGGLSVLRHVRALLPDVDLLYVADQAHVPYGGRPAAEILRFSAGITRFLLDRGAGLIVVACNTASAAALTFLRQAFPAVPFVGMEPAVKPGAARTRTGRVGVMATAGTFESQRYTSLMERYASHVSLYQDPCVGLVELVESGQVDGPAMEALLRPVLEPMVAAGIDTLILGCTHYPFALPAIQRLVGPDVAVIDPAPAVARQVARVLAGPPGAGAPAGGARAFTTGDPAAFAALAARLLGLPLPTAPLGWAGDHLVSPAAGP